MPNTTYPELWDNLRAECINQGLTDEMADTLINDLHTVAQRMADNDFIGFQEALSAVGKSLDKIPEGLFSKLWEALKIILLAA